MIAITNCFKPDQICELMAQSDYVLVAAALTPHTKGLVGAEAIAAVDWLVADQVASVSNVAPLILLAEDPQVKASVTALQAGAKDYLPLPASTSDLMAAIERATAYSVRKPVRVAEPVEMIGSSEIMNTLRQRIAKVGPTDSNIFSFAPAGFYIPKTITNACFTTISACPKLNFFRWIGHSF